ncbi:FAD-dependent oxidoreductase [Paraburkholderia sediminicola]|uniref:FAD-dependent oxidoreductase n=1 Tax=Paraburkholderia metrosideri TaxID=580937 RepID=A0ABW9DLK4_9BURK
MRKPIFMLLGGGLASATAAATLRAEGFDGRVVIVGDERHPPYSRPPLSKDVLRGEKTPKQTWLRPPEWYASKEIELQLGVRAVAVDRGAHEVEMANGERLTYDKLLIATGGIPRTLDIPGVNLPGVFFLTKLEESVALHDLLMPGTPVVVIGAGFIGAEVAASVRKLGCQVTILETSPIPLGRVLGPRIGQVYADLHRERGVILRTGIGVDRIEGNGRVQRVVASDGQIHEAAVVVIGIGQVPDIGLALRSGIPAHNGIEVDELCRTEAADIFAAGDIAHHPNRFLGRHIRVEHWQNAQHQGAAAARNMLGQAKPFHEVPWVWSDQYEHNLQVVGLPDPSGHLVVRGDLAERAFSAFFLRDGRVTAALAVNRPQDVRIARQMIQFRTGVSESQLADLDTSLDELLVADDN